MARCSYYDPPSGAPDYVPGKSKPCEKPAEVKLITDTGDECPGSYYCKKHADEIITEYKEKLDIVWTSRPLKDYEK